MDNSILISKYTTINWGLNSNEMNFNKPISEIINLDEAFNYYMTEKDFDKILKIQNEFNITISKTEYASQRIDKTIEIHIIFNSSEDVALAKLMGLI